MRSSARYIAIGTIAVSIAIGYLLFQRYTARYGPVPWGSMFGNEGSSKHERKWWKEVVVYEIYPASFKDSNDDGIGDIQGIISKLDYLHNLGVDVIAIGPHYKSPHVDMGYDISDYQDVNPDYGTLDDVQALIEATHAHGMRIIFDLVINHSSNQHKWFQESRSSKDNPKRDWYFWRPAKYDANGTRHPPNNWRSHFTVPAWTWDEATQEYYLHVYAPEMPDFNWENEECRQAIYDTAIVFWLDRGIDGFRIDTANKYSKDVSFPDAEIQNPKEETQPASQYYSNGPRIHEFLGEMRKIFDSYEAMTAGELSSFEGSEADVMMFVSAHKGQLNMVFNFDTVSLGHKDRTKAEKKLFQVADFKSEVTRWQAFVDGTDGWITNFLENHDNMRSISHYGDDSLEYRVRSGKMLAMISATMTGTLFLYQGQEIGMVNAPRWWPPEEYKDVRSVNYYKKALERFKDDPKALEAAVASMWGRARDHARLPMQWNDGPNAGFTSPGVTPWMRIHDGWRENNAEQQMKDHNSLLSFWKRLLQLRKDYKDLFVYGRYKWLETDDEDVFIYTKEGDSGMKLITVVNMSNKQKTWDGLPEILGTNYTTKIFNVEEVDESILSPWEGRVYINTS